DFRDTIDIGVDVTHPMPITSSIFPASTVVEELRALRDRVDVAEAERATLHAAVRLMGEVETSLCNRMRDERQTRIRIKR
ncbi:hypothetical protein Tco_0518571, partial [Tanacetum coccineum]